MKYVQEWEIKSNNLNRLEHAVRYTKRWMRKAELNVRFTSIKLPQDIAANGLTYSCTMLVDIDSKDDTDTTKVDQVVRIVERDNIKFYYITENKI